MWHMMEFLPHILFLLSRLMLESVTMDLLYQFLTIAEWELHTTGPISLGSKMQIVVLNSISV